MRFLTARTAVVLALIALLGTAVLAPVGTRVASAQTGSGATTSVTGSFTCTAAGAPSSVCTAAGQVVDYATTITITHFKNVGGHLLANGTAATTLTDAGTGTVLGTPTQTLTNIPVASATGTCNILTLVLGPLHLNLLGLVVDLNQVNLVITAVQGPGNLLGNLLCAVANLLNRGVPLGSLAPLLNGILALL
jgi:hypothetical protein